MRTLLDLILPLECGGCAAPGSKWCTQCREALSVPPTPLRPRIDPGVPCWAIGTYSGPRRLAVIAAKERGRRDLAEPLGAAIAHTLGWLRDAGELDPPELAPTVLIPAPTRARAARVRGGDPVTAMATAAARRGRGVAVAPLLSLRGRVRDSVGLTADLRQRNLAGRVRVRTDRGVDAAANVVLVDDVITTGSTASESVRSLARAGIEITAVVVVAAA
ncbi:ComF family protein [Antrihabitans sp. YC3-6]|uniref:ComF family protein n=1 Tax=Antrihabitans stalagmiti TaxID=2799499 RepID=A0A934U1A9_9NOCA|nr:ComF family protein [Antrihabitans stalagmiti]MBJ8338399.1 ComF family protein [Antrihabitans stalagmiti]